MRNRFGIVLALLLVVPGLLFTVACAKKTTGVQPAETQMAAPTGPTAEELAAKALQEAKDKFVNEDINFEFDKSVLLPEAQDILRSKAKFLQDNPDIKTTIEGHCDERGTNDYNMALGDRRANSAKQFLIDLGIDAARLDTISYGEEKPVDAGHNEEAWAKNRRDHFIIK